MCGHAQSAADLISQADLPADQGPRRTVRHFPSPCPVPQAHDRRSCARVEEGSACKARRLGCRGCSGRGAAAGGLSCWGFHCNDAVRAVPNRHEAGPIEGYCIRAKPPYEIELRLPECRTGIISPSKVTIEPLHELRREDIALRRSPELTQPYSPKVIQAF